MHTITWDIEGANPSDFTVERTSGFVSGGDRISSGNTTATLTVTFSPQSETPSERSATLIVRTSSIAANPNSHTVALSGTTRVTPELIVDETPLTFEATEVGVASTTVETVAVSTEGHYTHALEFRLEGTHAADFHVDYSDFDPATGGDLVVTFTPIGAVAPVTRTATLIITSKNNSYVDEPLTREIPLSGTVILHPTLTADETPIEFVATRKGGTSTTKEIAVSVGVTNVHTHILTVELSDETNFELVHTPADFNTATGGTVKVRFTPKAYSVAPATLTISSNLNAELTRTINLTGEVLQPTLTIVDADLLRIASGSASITVQGANLGDAITVAVGDADFTISPATTTLQPNANGAVNHTLSVFFAGTEDKTTNITFSSPAATTTSEAVVVHGKADVLVGWNFRRKRRLNTAEPDSPVPGNLTHDL
jgi:hypothetical protein